MSSNQHQFRVFLQKRVSAYLLKKMPYAQPVKHPGPEMTSFPLKGRNSQNGRKAMGE